MIVVMGGGNLKETKLCLKGHCGEFNACRRHEARPSSHSWWPSAEPSGPWCPWGRPSLRQGRAETIEKLKLCKLQKCKNTKYKNKSRTDVLAPTFQQLTNTKRLEFKDAR
jgi:hypothetical protein